MKSSAKILTFYQNGQKQSSFELQLGKQRVLTIGSQMGNVDVVLQHQLVSRIHAQAIWNGEGQLQMIDSGSTNGTMVNGKRIGAHIAIRITVGDQVTFGSVQAGSMVLGESGVLENQNAQAPVAKSLMALLSHKPEISIGRQADCDVVIDSSTVSRVHAKMRKLPDGRIFLIDLGSTNGTFLNGQKVHGNVQVNAGDKIIVGRSVLTLEGGPRNLSGEIAIRTEGLLKKFKNGKIGLHDASFSIPAGSLVAIMGPSGCGKSTLLKCLTGEAPASRGKVYLHNLELIQNYPFLKTLIGYVPQEDIVHKELTVEQSLYFAARLRMEHPTRLEIDQKIQDVLMRLRIAHIRHSPIAKISGGQRKRVSIAVELLTDPLILFLDEPTSPLDPQTIDEFLKILQDLAHKGTTVVMVTHKPEDLEYMDSVIFMAEGGAMVYDGPANAYRQYFGVRTAVEVYANISGERAQHWIAQFQAKHTQGHVNTSPNPRLIKRSNKGFLSQAAWLSVRYMRIKTNDLLNIAIMLGQAPIIAALICMIFSQVTRSVPFMITLSAIWFGTSNAAREIVAEGAIYRRERMFNLRIGAYILSKLLVLALFAGLQALLFSGIIALGFRDTDPVWNNLGGTIGWVWMMTITATLLGLMISALVDTSEKAMTLVPLVLIPQVMLTGVVAQIKSPIVEIVSYFSPSRWGNEGLMLVQAQVQDERLEGITFGAKGGSTVSSEFALREQFPSLYEDIFGGFAYTIGLDLVMIAVLSLMMFLVLFVGMRRKDSI